MSVTQSIEISWVATSPTGAVELKNVFNSYGQARSNDEVRTRRFIWLMKIFM
jgi:hypothetical protein